MGFVDFLKQLGLSVGAILFGFTFMLTGMLLKSVPLNYILILAGLILILFGFYKMPRVRRKVFEA